MNVNISVLAGTLSKDPLLREVSSGKKVCNFLLIVDRPMKGKNGEKVSDLFPVVCWDKVAENVAAYMKKGRNVLVQGYFTKKTYTNKEGQNVVAYELNAHSVQFLGGEKQSNNNENNDDSQ